MAEKKSEELELLSVKEAAAQLKFSNTYVYKLARENRIPHINFGRHIIFRKHDLFGWIGTIVKGA